MSEMGGRNDGVWERRERQEREAREARERGRDEKDERDEIAAAELNVHLGIRTAPALPRGSRPAPRRAPRPALRPIAPLSLPAAAAVLTLYQAP